MTKYLYPEISKECGERGFTLIEVILVMSIVVVLTAVILDRNSVSADRTRLRGQSELLKSQLRYAQARSMNANSVWGIKADGDNLSLFNGGNASNRMYLPGENDKTIAYNSGDLSGLQVNDFTLSFDDLGRPCSDEAGDTLRTATLSITLTSAGGAAATIDVTPNTGFIQ